VNYHRDLMDRRFCPHGKCSFCCHHHQVVILRDPSNDITVCFWLSKENADASCVYVCRCALKNLMLLSHPRNVGKCELSFNNFDNNSNFIISCSRVKKGLKRKKLVFIFRDKNSMFFALIILEICT
jgi:hypothetical protein